ncbi:uncharacterized protein LOC118795767 [Megalops cyprinoides]|uniref:uncharacterized protein LOC118795767 n=1 Tax=Megalops cyprinoides TaxID=118141 RepID=UPI001863FCB5|nr:uncharacterized protein LOC118795767 [Megalops cyprinoides]
MHSGSRQPGRRCAAQRGNLCQRWVRGGPHLQREPALRGPRWQTERPPPLPDRRKGTRPGAGEEPGELQREVSAHPRGRPPSEGPNVHAPQGSYGAAGQGQGQWNPARWVRTPEPGPQFRAAEERCRGCACPGHYCWAGPHPLRMKCAPLPPNGFGGQQNHRSDPGGASDWQLWDHAPERYCSDPQVPEQVHSRTQDYNRQVALNSAPFPSQEFSSDGGTVNDSVGPKRKPEQLCNGLSSVHGGFFPTEIPQARPARTREQGPLRPSSTPPYLQTDTPSKGTGQTTELALNGPKRNQATVRDQIRRVVEDLEGVLCGLKQVHLEMKEVVQQIDLLTSHIDLNTMEAGSSSRMISYSHPRVGGQGSAQAQSISPAHSPSVLMTDRGVPLTSCSSPPGPGPGFLSNGIRPTTHPPRDQGGGAYYGPRETELPLSIPATQTQTQGGWHGSGMAAPRDRRPPPYPHDRQVVKLGTRAKGPPSSLKTPPHPGKRRQASSAV